MTKLELKLAAAALKTGDYTYAARVLDSLYRAASTRSQKTILKICADHQITIPSAQWGAK